MSYDVTVRYQAYAKANGRTPTAQRTHDQRAFPGGRMAGFIVWIQAQWRTFFAADGLKRPAHITPDMHARFDAWLLASAPAAPAAWEPF